MLVGLPPEASIAKDEFFGPVAINSFETEEEAISLANGTDFGLGSVICSRDVEGAHQVGSRIEAGMVFINDIVHSDPRAPFGGFRVRARAGRAGAYEPQTDLAGYLKGRLGADQQAEHELQEKYKNKETGKTER